METEAMELDPQDLILRCIECQEHFILTPGEIQFYLDRQLHIPKRCPTCRKARRVTTPVPGWAKQISNAQASNPFPASSSTEGVDDA